MSTRRILRYSVLVDDQWHLLLVPRSGVLHVGCRRLHEVEFWMRESESGSEVRAFRVFGTGQPIPDAASYEGTVQSPGGGALVWHLLSAHAELGEPA